MNCTVYAEFYFAFKFVLLEAHRISSIKAIFVCRRALSHFCTHTSVAAASSRASSDDAGPTKWRNDPFVMLLFVRKVIPGP
jgi:hypothetical protein